ncbi:hypothetical protein [Mycobacterium asiaticum]|uniref:hypothetical protein n=1 Tax=Mycobacterium asiaticum TaxID=1790 RepID=UPI000A4D493C|nr:hypothetical protein [Mycobacterium asiaticum]
MGTPDHVENTGNNLRAAAEQQAQHADEDKLELPPEDRGFATPPLEGPDAVG